MWTLLLERFKLAPDRQGDLWYRFLQRVKHEGWTPSSIRAFERAVLPCLSSRRLSSLPPTLPPEQLPGLADLVDFEVVFPANDDDPKLDIPDAHLLTVFQIVRRALQHAAGLLADIDTGYWNTTSFIPGDHPGRHYPNEASKYFNWVKALFDRLCQIDQELAHAEVRQWPRGERYFFDKLTIYAWMKPDVVPASEVESGVLNLSDDAFWEQHHRRELLHMLKARWKAFRSAARREIERRIVGGDTACSSETTEEHQLRVRRTAAVALGWLLKNGCELSDDTDRILHELRGSDPHWNPVRDRFADESFDVHVDSVATVTDPSSLLTVPLSELIATAKRRSGRDHEGFVEHVPLRGLIEKDPRRVLGALRSEQRKGATHSDVWRTLLSLWPAGSSDRLLLVCASRVNALKPAVIGEIRYEVTWWFREYGSRLAAQHPRLALQLFDHIVETLAALGPSSTRSALGEVSIGGRTIRRSRLTYDHTINGPVGRITDGLLLILNGRQLPPASGIPEEIANRLDGLFSMPGEGAAHAVSETALNLLWLYGLDPKWVRTHLITMFDVAHPLAEAAWNGFLHATRVPAGELFGLLKPHFLAVFGVVSKWKWKRDTAHNKLVEFLVVACYWKRRDRRYVSLFEARAALRLVDDSARAHTVWMIATQNAELTWSRFGSGFFEKAWPREIQFKSPAVSRQLAFLAERSGEDFPKAVSALSGLLVPTNRLDTTVHRATDGGEKSLAARFPEATLELLDGLTPNEPDPVPYGLRAILHQIGESAPLLRADHRWKRLNRIANAE